MTRREVSEEFRARMLPLIIGLSLASGCDKVSLKGGTDGTSFVAAPHRIEVSLEELPELDAGPCHSAFLDVRVSDQLGNDMSGGLPLDISYELPDDGSNFVFSDANCSIPLQEVELSQGDEAFEIHFQAPRAGSVSLPVQLEAELTEDGDWDYEIKDHTFSFFAESMRVRLVSTATATVGMCKSLQFVSEIEDDIGQFREFPMPETYLASLPGVSGIQYLDGASCGLPLAGYAFAEGQSSFVISVLSSIAGTYQIPLSLQIAGSESGYVITPTNILLNVNGAIPDAVDLSEELSVDVSK